MMDSVLSQTYENFELIICDDASTDRTNEMVTAREDERIRLLDNELNLGEGATRDRAIAAARGEWIALLDADDAYMPYRLERMMEVANYFPGCMLFDEITECHDGASGMVPWRTIRRPSAPGNDKCGPRVIEFDRFISCSRTMIKPMIPARLIRQWGITHSAKLFSADLEFFLRLLAHKVPLVYIPEPMYLYRISAAAMSTNPDRYSLLLGTLEESIDWFADDSGAVEAIRCKIRDVRCSEEYQPFFSAIMSGRFARAGRLAWKRPWVVPEFIRRSLERIPYHLHRMIHRGVRRETR